MSSLLAQTSQPTQPAEPLTGPAASVPGWGLTVIGLSGIGFVLFSLIRHSRRIARSTGEEPRVSAPQASWLARRLKKADAGGAEGELTASARALLAELDGRVARMESLIEAADRRIAELERLGTGRGPTGAGGRGRAEGTGARRAGRASEPKAPSPVAGPTGGDRLTQTICHLADEGSTPLEIAEATGHSVSEINLVLALRA